MLSEAKDLFFACTRKAACCPSALRTTNDQRLTTPDQIHKQPHRSRHARRQLPEECISRVDIGSLAVVRDKQSALLFAFSRIVRFEQRRKVRVPLRHEVETALLHPSLKISLRNFIRKMKDRVRGIENRNRSLFHRNPRPAQRRWKRRVFARIKIDRHPKRSQRVVLHDQAPTILDEIEQTLVV